MATNLFDNPWDMFTDISKFCRDNNIKVISSDDPITRIIGFETDVDYHDPLRRHWGVRLTALKGIRDAERGNTPESFVRTVLEKISSSEGRQEIAKLLSSGAPLVE